MYTMIYRFLITNFMFSFFFPKIIVLCIYFVYSSINHTRLNPNSLLPKLATITFITHLGTMKFVYFFPPNFHIWQRFNKIHSVLMDEHTPLVIYIIIIVKCIVRKKTKCKKNCYYIYQLYIMYLPTLALIYYVRLQFTNRLYSPF